MSEIFAIKDTGKGIIKELSPDKVVPIKVKESGEEDSSGLTLEQARLNGNVLEGNIFGNAEFDKQGDRKAFAQLSDVYDSNSYSTNETLTGGTWIDGKPIYTITKATGEPIPEDIDTRFPDEIVGSYTVYKYTKTTD